MRIWQSSKKGQVISSEITSYSINLIKILSIVDALDLNFSKLLQLVKETLLLKVLPKVFITLVKNIC